MADRAAGILLWCGNKILLLKKAKNGTWDFPGGRLDDNESFLQGALREFEEETGYFLNGGDPRLIWISDNGDRCYVTFEAEVEEPFKPELSDEHEDYRWTNAELLPTDVHPGIREMFTKLQRNEKES